MQGNTPPRAAKKPHQLEKHGDVRTDPYYWLRERDSDEVLAYLKAENEYYEAMTAHTREFQERLFLEMKSRIKEDDSSVPYKWNGYWYITRYESGMQYPVYTRHKETLEAPEELLFDANQMAAGFEFFDIRGISISPDNQLAPFRVDTHSRRE